MISSYTVQDAWAVRINWKHSAIGIEMNKNKKHATKRYSNESHSKADWLSNPLSEIPDLTHSSDVWMREE